MKLYLQFHQQRKEIEIRANSNIGYLILMIQQIFQVDKVLLVNNGKKLQNRSASLQELQVTNNSTIYAIQLCSVHSIKNQNYIEMEKARDDFTKMINVNKSMQMAWNFDNSKYFTQLWTQMDYWMDSDVLSFDDKEQSEQWLSENSRKIVKPQTMITTSITE
ncbi:Ubiquitin-like_domain superfamily [Hexamita inflata]|uniref:Ubiquitin-like domain superfamily n=1 Tax=Hexamita inflata TaxID=28002 RepID=A0AA86PZT0_9EUKA|nr:Ubiquitin-like domain superfamily [Hexamita inflata]